ncbi:hypothetical protein BDV38DRAFT_291879 [Aspergillus pseudotamarii]|uniref:DUF4246 domain-containing protein n=1 Tax=Aspergillus pseudotamarii TaxID=132259 RepID=A0A5N6SYJ1_ASPPS|nr:uncharacterized protein BDV38DRAFT_291879 [Aspergillus pseudotamarii]KAE8138849.1 hypothetical protein BDV38DRAFT_291879 [Aspergillus pseudotamarii]
MESSPSDARVQFGSEVINELQWKAGILNETRYRALKEQIWPPDNIPENEKDSHPRSDQTVVDLVHPSLFPVIYGRTHVLPDLTIDLNDCIASMGQGKLLPVPPDKEVYVYPERRPSHKPDVPLLNQWLQCDVKLTESGCRIASYINNLQLVKDQGLYDVIGKIITITIPLWEKSLASRHSDEDRIKYTEVQYGEHIEPEPIPPWDGVNIEDYSDENTPYLWSEAEEDAYYELTEPWEASRPIILPEPGEFRPHEETEYKKVDLRKEFPGQRLQIIVKLANIELTPENPEYEDSSWHVEGQLVSAINRFFPSRIDPVASRNELIVALAIYYHDSENITPSVWYQQRHEFLQTIYGFGNDTSGYGKTNVTRELGSVLCQDGRLLTFPNTVLHRVSSFSLADRSKPGHRKVLALLLVDPYRRIISSSNVPPQREDWLPNEFDSKVKRDMNPLMTMDGAREARLELMAHALSNPPKAAGIMRPGNSTSASTKPS